MAKAAQMVKHGKIERLSYSRINEVMEMPNFIEIQTNSYKWFLDKGLKEVFRDIDEITDYTGNLVLSFIDYRMEDKPKYSIRECKKRDVTYAAPMRVTARLYNKETGEIKENEVYMGDFPLMTDSGTFIINGAERAIVSQLVRSPGVYFDIDHDKVGKELYKAQIIPNRGAWLEYETDQNDLFYVRIDKNRKIFITTFIRALFCGTDLGNGTNEEIIDLLGDDIRLTTTMEKDEKQNAEEALLEVYRKLRPGEPPTLETAQAQLDMLFFDPHRYDISRVGRYKYNKKLAISDRIVGAYTTDMVINQFTGEIIAEENELITPALAHEIEQGGVMKMYVRPTEDSEEVICVLSNGMVDIKPFLPQFTAEQLDEVGINEMVSASALKTILEAAEAEGWDDAALLEKLKECANDLIPKHIVRDDIFASINYLNCLAKGLGTKDDIDHLGNRRIRCVGELLQNQFRIGFTRMERVVRERMTIQAQDSDKLTPQALISIRPVVAAIKEFFGSSPLSQFMDQNNPLAELTHKRRLSALGPGGLSRERA
ncbi:MAG TPA: DNA-directed RNA polymerase subunit beta, partial [Ruminococcaceae bacterium]|nr:DNA-directed RNA polymerase subunit beta [Oscillospiraceae bacterium]